MAVSSQPLPGMADLFGLPLRKRRYLGQAFAAVVERAGYEQLTVPLIERAASFSEEIVGDSPWPEWDQRGCFYLSVRDYEADYDQVVGETPAVLIPEGTISVSRWLGGLLDQPEPVALPLKVWYELPCLRNELLDTLSDTKRREFTQFGLEVLGAANPAADTEVLCLVQDLLMAVGVDPAGLRARLSDVRVFNQMVEESEIPQADRIALKEAMDGIAECRAGKRPERLSVLRGAAEEVLGRQSLQPGAREAWRTVLGHAAGRVTRELRSALGAANRDTLDYLDEMQHKLAATGLGAAVDLCVVRSHEYYTGLSFELDIVTPAATYVEVAGGGRYDKLVGNFTQAVAGGVIPCTGFAFGVERVAAVLDALDLLSGPIMTSTRHDFGDSSADVLAVPARDPGAVAGYLATREKVAEQRQSARVDIYVGDDADEEQVARYARARGIAQRG
jgi:histidyl-tRNA synthetase